jgi:hypothetical protein
MSRIQHIETKFDKMGARIRIRGMTTESFRRHGRRPLVIDVLRTEAGEVFDIEKTQNVDLSVLDLQPRQRHLLLLAENWVGSDRFLCGHDERHWFVAALPNNHDIRMVQEAKASLKPSQVRRKERRRQGKRRRRSDVYIRQGEWFFIPYPHARIERNRIMRNAPLSRGPESTPHVCELMYLDGEREFECDRFPRLAFFESEYRKILKTRRKAKQWNWRPLPFDPDIYVRGKVTHPDHHPIYLDEWHFVQMNTERQNSSLVRVAYRD